MGQRQRTRRNKCWWNKCEENSTAICHHWPWKLIFLLSTLFECWEKQTPRCNHETPWHPHSPQAEDDEGSSSKGGNLLYFIIEYVAGRPWSLCTWLKDTAKFLSHNSGLWCWSGSYVCSHQQHDQWEKHWNHAAGHLIFLGIYKTLMWWLWWIFDGFRPHKLHGMRFCLSQAAKTGLCSRSQCLLIFSVGMCRWRSIKIWNIMKWYWRVLECLIVIFLGFCSVSTTPSPWGSVRTFLKKTYAW